jgi:hypothetical protein
MACRQESAKCPPDGTHGFSPGTDGSNPSPASGESGTNLTFGAYPTPQTACRVLRGSSAWDPWGSSRRREHRLRPHPSAPSRIDRPPRWINEQNCRQGPRLTGSSSVKNGAGKAARFNVSTQSTGGFDRLLPHTERDLPLPETPKGTILTHNDPESGSVG